MESLERLRRYVNEHTNKDWEYATFPPQRQLVNCTDTAVFGLIDAIEQEHAELMDKALGEQDDAIRHAREVAYSTGYEAGFDEGLASTDCWSADDWTGQHEDAMAERGWVKLPVSEDGEYIHVGDEMCGYGWPNGGVYCRAIVNEVMILVGPQDGAYRGWLMWVANECRHHHEPTVEDVLREFAERYLDYEGVPSAGRRGIGEALMDEYAAKLRLAKEDA